LIPPSLQGDVCVVGDPVQIEQVLLNLIRNAIDACEENGCVSVDIHPQTDTARILVSDTGPGIPEKDLPHVFDAFHSSKSDGMGLGLAICRSIVEAHYGQLHVCNTHEGAQFMFELPLCEAGKARKNTSEENA
jgi:signal transduction histidine kinase